MKTCIQNRLKRLNLSNCGLSWPWLTAKASPGRDFTALIIKQQRHSHLLAAKTKPFHFPCGDYGAIRGHTQKPIRIVRKRGMFITTHRGNVQVSWIFSKCSDCQIHDWQSVKWRSDSQSQELISAEWWTEVYSESPKTLQRNLNRLKRG